MKCNECGNELETKIERVGQKDNGEPIFEHKGYCRYCKKYVDTTFMYDTPPKKVKKKDSTLSIIACVMSIFSITVFPSVIIALVDLVKNDEDKRHIGSWFALALAVVWFVLLYI